MRVLDSESLLTFSKNVVGDNNINNNKNINNINNSNNNIRKIEATKKNGTEDIKDKDESKVNNLIQNTKRVYI